MSDLHIDVRCNNIDQNPHCFHGPTLKFCRRGTQSDEFFACSACRDRKFCSFYCKVSDNYQNQTKRAILARSRFVKDLKYKSYVETLKKLKQMPHERRGYCQTCNVLFDAQIIDIHSQCRKLVGLTKQQLLFPTEICVPNENNKVEAQYLFDKSTTKFIISSIKLLGINHVLCIGTPRLHEHLINSKMSSLLLDFDPKYHNFYSRKNFVWYNMFNHFTFDSRRMRTISNFLAKNGKLAILLDPPFGGRVEPIVETLKKINGEYRKAHLEEDDVWVMWFFPYFMERHIQDSLPNFKMLDYHVNYENHDSFSNVGPRRRKFGSPVRIFTNIPLNLFDLSAVSGYKFCHSCDHWVSDNNRHCDSCKTCTSKARQFVLFEHAAGYALFSVKEFEEIAAFQAQVEASVTDLSRFNSVIKLVAFTPFKMAANALENINSVSEGIVSQDLQLFLKNSLPKSGKSGKTILGVADAKLGAAISEALPVSCSHVGIFPEIIRGIRMHFAYLVKGFTPKSSGTAQLGLGHAYSRAKVKFNVHRADNMVIQSIALLDQLDKDINTFSMRIREWYSYHFPELVKIVPENYTFARLAQFIKNRKDLTNEKLEALEEITMDSAKAQAIIDASRSSMGMDIAELDLLNIDLFATRVIELSQYRKRLAEYLSAKMSGIAPNLQMLIGDQVGARLIAHAGSLTNLAKYPSSTVQILGAEKALFRALKTRTNTPKYGLLYNSTFIGRAGAKNKGRISRYLANKCSIASRIDCFSDNPTNVFGDKLKQQVEDRLKFYEQGDIPRKNIDVMKEAMEEAAILIEEQQAQVKKKKKKDKKKAKNGLDVSVSEENLADGKKKKRKNTENLDETLDTSGVEEEKTKKKKKKNRKSSENGTAHVEEEDIEVEEPVKKKKKKKNVD